MISKISEKFESISQNLVEIYDYIFERLSEKDKTLLIPTGEKLRYCCGEDPSLATFIMEFKSVKRFSVIIKASFFYSTVEENQSSKIITTLFIELMIPHRHKNGVIVDPRILEIEKTYDSLICFLDGGYMRSGEPFLAIDTLKALSKKTEKKQKKYFFKEKRGI